jgi:type I restriction enzyme, S subunit
MEDWIQIPLEKAADITMGQSPDSKFYNNIGKGIKFLQGCAEFGERFPDTSVYCSQPARIAMKNSILFSVRAPVGRINIADQDYCIGRGLAALVPKEIDESFFYWQLIYFTNYSLRNTQGSTFDSINSNELKKLEILKPLDRREQTAIATIISKVDKAIEETEKIIEKYKRIKTGLMQELLTKGIDEKGNIRSEKTHRFKDSQLGRIPEEWEIKSLGINCNVKGRIGWRGYRIEDLRDNGPLVIGGTQISKDHKLDFSHSVYLSKEKYEESPEIQIKQNDIILVKTGNTIGKTALIDSNIGEACINPNTIIIRSTRYDSYFLYIFLITEYFQRQLWDAVYIGAQPSVNQTSIKSIPILFFDKKEQERIAQRIKNIQDYIEVENNKLQKKERIKKGLMQNLLSGKVPVPEELIKEINKN